jgi:hypothetical protein
MLDFTGKAPNSINPQAGFTGTPRELTDPGYQEEVQQQLPQKLFISPYYSIAPTFVDQVTNQNWLPKAVQTFKSSIYNKIGPDLTPEEVQARYGFTPDKPLTDLNAQYIGQRKEKEKRVEEILSFVNPDATGSTVLPFLSALGGSVLDPLSLGVMKVLGVGLGAAANLYKTTNAAAKAGTASGAMLKVLQSSSSGAKVARLAGVGAVEGVVESLFRESVSGTIQDDFTLEDAGSEILFSTIIGAGFGAAGVAFDNFKANRARKYVPTPGAATEAASAITSLGRRVDQPTLLLEYQNKVNKGRTVPYDYTPLDTVRMNADQVFYGAQANPQDGFNIVGQRVSSPEFGSGIVLTDDPFIAQSSATTGENQGAVFTTKLTEANLLDLDAIVPEELKPKILEIFGQILDPDELDFVNFDSFNNVYDYARAVAEVEGNTGLLNGLNNIIKEQGYDGYRFENTYGDMKSNGIMLLNTDKMNFQTIETASRPATVLAEDGVTAPAMEAEVKAMMDDYTANPIYIPEYDDFAATNVLNEEALISDYITRLETETTTSEEFAEYLNNTLDPNGADIGIDFVERLDMWAPETVEIRNSILKTITKVVDTSDNYEQLFNSKVEEIYRSILGLPGSKDRSGSFKKIQSKEELAKVLDDFNKSLVKDNETQVLSQQILKELENQMWETAEQLEIPLKILDAKSGFIESATVARKKLMPKEKAGQVFKALTFCKDS